MKLKNGKHVLTFVRMGANMRHRQLTDAGITKKTAGCELSKSYMPQILNKFIRDFSSKDPAEEAKSKPKVTQDPRVVDLTKMKKLQEHYQKEDGVPIFLKAGVRDKVLFQATVILCAVGLGMTFKFYYDMCLLL